MKKLLLILLALALLAVVFLWVANRKSPVSSYSVSNQPTDVVTTAEELYREFNTDETGANEKYLNKIIVVSGMVTAVKQSAQGEVAVTLASGRAGYGVRCRLDRQSKHVRTDFNVGEKVAFKGVCMGAIRDVELVDCVEED